MNTRQLCTGLLALVCAAAQAEEGGFSYVMGVGRQDFRYTETGSNLPFKSEGRSGGPLLVTGALYQLPGGVLFSLDSENTFYPGRGQETWRATSTVFNGVTLSTPELQRNGFSLRQSHTQLAGHWPVLTPVSAKTYALGGLGMRTQSFKRYSFEVGPDGAVSVPKGTTVEESTSEVLLHLGLALESGPLRGQPTHYGLRVSVAKPVWRRVENTSQPQALFTGTNGWDLAVEGRYSWAVVPHVHLGAWGKLTTAQRGTQALGANLELPRSRLDSVAGGLELLWKL